MSQDSSSSRTHTGDKGFDPTEPARNSHVLTLVGPAAREAERSLRQAFEGMAVAVGERRQLSGPGDSLAALDLPLGTSIGPGLEHGGLSEELLAAVEATLAGWQSRAAQEALDWAFQPSAGRRKKLLVADMESTLIRNEMLDELADRVGARQRVADITARAMNGEIDFPAAMAERVGLLAGLSSSVIDECLGEVVYDAGAGPLVATLTAHGVPTALVSGGFSVFAEPVAERLGFDKWFANRLGIAEGKLTGEVHEPLLDGGAKLRILRQLCAEHDLETSAAVTVGDGANDLAMLGAAGLGVAYHGKASVAAEARFRVDHGDLSTLLYFLGYPRSTWQPGPAISTGPSRAIPK